MMNIGNVTPPNHLVVYAVFEPTCANARWALMRRFPSVRLSVCRYTKSH